MPSNQTSDKPRCGVELKKRGPNGEIRYCRRFPIEFGTVCPHHGGRLPQVKMGAEKRRIEFQIGKAAQELGLAEPVENPLLALKALAGEVLQWKNLCREHLRDLREVGYSTEASGEQVAAKVQVWERALDRSITALATLARLNIDDRLAAIEAKQAQLVSQAFAAAMESLGVDPEARANSAVVFARHLRVIEGAA